MFQGYLYNLFLWVFKPLNDQRLTLSLRLCFHFFQIIHLKKMQMFCKVEISKGIEKTIGRTIAISKGSERLRIGLVDNSLRQTARMIGIGCALIDRSLE